MKETLHQVFTEFSLTIDFIMDRLGFGGDTDAEFGEKRTQRIHKNRGNLGHRMFQYLWHLGTIVLVVGTLAGLCILAAQYEVSRAGVGKVWNASQITNLSVMSTSPEESPHLFVIPVRPIKGTNLIAVSKLSQKKPRERC